jgi:hypothetical protein
MTDDEMLDMVRQRAVELGHVPHKSEMIEAARLKARFGAWNRVLEAAGLKKISRRTQERLIKKQDKKAAACGSNHVLEVKNMNVNWFKNPDHVAYVPVDEFADNFGKETGIPNLGEELNRFRNDPVAEGINIKGRKRTTLKVFIPNKVFDEKIYMGDNVWVFLGENYESYCIYWPEQYPDKCGK